MNFLDSLPFPILQEIGDFLSLVDLMCLRITCKKYSKLLMKINERMNCELNKYFSENIVESIKKNIVITGSFILRFLYDAKWKPNDIDLYIENEFSNQRWNFIACLLDNNFVEIKQIGNPHYYIISRYYQNQNCQLKINIVSLNTINPIEYIFTVSDMDIGKIAFYGHIVPSEEKLFIKNWKKILYKYDKIVPLSLVTSNIYDGIDIRKNNNLEDSIDKMYERKEKYIQRGFKISVVENLNYIIDTLKNDYKKFVDETTEDIYIKKKKIKKEVYIGLKQYLKNFHTDTSILLN